MRNIHDLKSFHENALNEWNATALIMKEALKDEPDTRKTFVEVVLALSDMAGKDEKKRQNLLKAGHVVLHGLADGKWPKTPPPLPAEPNNKPDRWKGVRRVALTLFALMLCVGSFAGGFALNIPRVVSNLPRTSTQATPSNTPEELLKQLAEAIPRRDMQRILSLYAPSARKESVQYQISDIIEGFERGVMPQIRLDSMNTETTARIFVTVIANEKEVDSGTISLRQIENVWYIERISM